MKVICIIIGLLSSTVTSYDSFAIESVKPDTCSLKPHRMGHSAMAWNTPVRQPVADRAKQASSRSKNASSPQTTASNEPDTFVLHQNFPNPFNPSTTIEYALPIRKQISVKIYNIMGQLVRTLVDNQLQTAGTHKVMWDGKNENGVSVSSGTYIYTLEFGNFRKSNQMTLIK